MPLWNLLAQSDRDTKLDVAYSCAVAVLLMLFVAGIVPPPYGTWLLAAVSFIGILPVLRSALEGIRQKKITVDLLASVALIFSFIAREWASAAFINLMLATARIFHGITEARAKRILERLLAFRPKTAIIQRGEEVDEIPLGTVQVGDMAVLRSGDRVAVDGIVESGQASVNESTLTGEHEPVTKKIGDRVYSSTLVASGSLIVRVDRVGEDTTLAKIIRLVSEGTRAKSKIERIGDRFAAWYIGITFVGGLGLYIVTGNAHLVLAILLVVCADDIAVANPLAFSIIMAKAASRGIIIKGGDSVERLATIRAIIADKTGTLTAGKPKVEQILYVSAHDPAQVLMLLAAAEGKSNHPVAQAIMAHLTALGVRPESADSYEEFPGEGVVAAEQGIKVFSGKLRFVQEQGVLVSDAVLDRYAELVRLGKTVVLLAEPKGVMALIVLVDALRENAKKAISLVKRHGITHWVMLTGDNERAAWHVARELNIHTFKAEVTPREKLEYIQTYRKKMGSVAMIGDGVNDAAALAVADVGIAMGFGGSDVAVESADVALMRDELMRIPEVFALSRHTMHVVRVNFVIWVITNAIGLGLVFAGVLGPAGAAAYNFGTDLITIGNALLVLNYRFDPNEGEKK